MNKLVVARAGEEFEAAEGRGDTAAGWLRQLFRFCNAFGVGEYRRAIPFMEDGELHMGYHEEMLNFVLEFGCMPPLDIRVPDDFGGEECADAPTTPAAWRGQRRRGDDADLPRGQHLHLRLRARAAHDGLSAAVDVLVVGGKEQKLPAAPHAVLRALPTRRAGRD